LLSQKSGKALVQNQKLADELINEKQALEKHIEQRTIELQKQADELKAYHEKQELQIWINQGLSEVADEIRKNRGDLKTVASGLMNVVLKRVKAPVGALYFQTVDSSDNELRILSNIGLDSENADEVIDSREGLVGKCFSTGQPIILEKVPEGFFRITSGLGKATPTSMLILPLLVDGKCIGVTELASFKPFTTEQREYIERAFDNIAAQLNIIQMNNYNQKLIDEYRQRENDYSLMEKELVQVKEELNMIKST
jgi:putative methionine-R-sulfoxide reductase with GAF domain